MQLISQDILSYLRRDTAYTMQLATVQGSGPWIATVYFVADDELNLYWLSWPERRHSREIAECAQVAAAIVMQAEQPVVGIQGEGTASIVTDNETIEWVMQLYAQKYQQGEKFAQHHAAGTNHHVLYKLKPTTISLFDEERYAGRSPIVIGL